MSEETKEPSAERAEILRLRARIVMLERAVALPLRIAARLYPEELSGFLTTERKALQDQYRTGAIAGDITDPVEREYLAAQVDVLIKELEADFSAEEDATST